MSPLERFARRFLDPEGLGHSVTEEVRAAARQALVDAGLRLPLGSVTANAGDSAHAVMEAPAPRNFQIVPQLRTLDREMPALLLRSLHGTHAEIFEFLPPPAPVEKYFAGDAAVFRHRGNGRCYVVIVSPDRGNPVERIGRCEDCGMVDHHLVDALCPACRPRYRSYGPGLTA